MPCEDYPCCGHEAGDCPLIGEDGELHFKCVGCGKLLPASASSPICGPCQEARVWERDEDGYQEPEDY